jgi:cytochrome c biogenesis protein CcmG, thiol:disulfide interchange protein DsbE
MAANPSLRIARLASVPLCVFAVLAAVFFIGLKGNDPSIVPSALIGQRVPTFQLPPLEGMALPGLASADLARGKVTLVNVFASWCGPCRLEHPVLMQLSKRGDIAVAGINYKDEPENARRFLTSLGVPYQAIGADPAGRASIDWGVYGVPETFVVDGKGIIRFKWVGPLSDRNALERLEAAIRDAKGGA